MPTNGTLVLQAIGSDVYANYSVAGNGREYARGVLTPEEPVSVPDLYMGSYIVSINLPDGVLLTGLNGYPSLQRRAAQWLVTITGGKDSLYQIELRRSAAVSGSVTGLESDAEITIAGSEIFSNVFADSFRQSGLIPGEYTVTLVLPQARYSGEGWSFVDSAGQTLAITKLKLESGDDVVLPVVERIIPGSIGGSVADAQGKPAEGVRVYVYGESGELAAQSVTDAQGAWLISEISDGVYSVVYDSGNATEIRPDTAEISRDHLEAVLWAQMSAPGSVSGSVIDAQGQPAKNVLVSLYDEDNELSYETLTNDQGAWDILEVANGTYSVRYDAGSDMMLSPDTFQITSAQRSAVLHAQASTPASLQVQVFVDANNNGSLGKNEPMLSGAVISLLLLENGTETVVASAETDGSGNAVLYAPEGEYTLRCELPANYGYAKKGGKNSLSSSMMDQSVERVQDAAVALRLGHEAEFGIGASEMAALTGTVWQDDNCDGLWQSGEPGVAGVKISADGVRNGLHYETVTDENGRFEISQIRNGTYNVTYHVPEGYVFTYKANGAKQLRSLMTTEADREGKDQVIFEEGKTVDEQNIGLVVEAVVDGYCFLDANYNGLFDAGEEPLAGVEIELFRQSNNKRLKTTVSDENGYYRFGNVRADTFKLKALLPKDMAYTVCIPGDSQANQFSPRDNRREQTVLNVEGVCGESVRVMLGAIQYGSVSGVVFEDDNLSGDWETGEKIVQGISVTLLNADGEPVKSTKTNKNGAYTFTELAPGSYTLRMTAKAGYAFTLTGAGSVISNIGGGQGESAPFRIALDEDLTGVDAGLIVPARVSGVVFADANDNGMRDAGEHGLSGTVVTLMTELGEAERAVVGADGEFLFDAVLPGRYCLRYELPEGAVFSPVAEGGHQIAGEDGVGVGEWFTVTTGDAWSVADCGGLYLGQIAGTSFGDSNGNGRIDETETRMAGVELTLTPSRSDLLSQTILTGADGSFSFESLHPGTYTLAVRCPEGYVLSRLGAVTLGLAEGEADQSISLSVGMGAKWTEQQLGCVLPASYSGIAWLDENLNGRHDAGELPAAGEKITLTDLRDGSEVCTMITDGQGLFTADGLAPGEYSLSFALADDVRGAISGDSTFLEADGVLVMSGVTIREGTADYGAKLGLVRETTLSGLVWLDSDGTTLPVEGAQVTLVDGANEVQVTTGADGVYTFDGLMPGEYAVQVVLPEKLLALEPGDRRTEDGSMISILAENKDNTGRSGAIAVRMAQHQLQLDIGSVRSGRLGDFCWLDLNGNGLQDGDEGGIPGVVINLTRNGEIVAETVSDQYGFYIFKELYPGEYVIRAAYPAEVKPTVLRTDLPHIVSVLGENGQSIPVPVDSDGVSYGADLGFVLIDKDHLPAGYGEGMTQDWKFER